MQKLVMQTIKNNTNTLFPSDSATHAFNATANAAAVQNQEKRKKPV